MAGKVLLIAMILLQPAPLLAVGPSCGDATEASRCCAAIGGEQAASDCCCAQASEDDSAASQNSCCGKAKEADRAPAPDASSAQRTPRLGCTCRMGKAPQPALPVQPERTREDAPRTPLWIDRLPSVSAALGDASGQPVRSRGSVTAISHHAQIALCVWRL